MQTHNHDTIMIKLSTGQTFNAFNLSAEPQYSNFVVVIRQFIVLGSPTDVINVVINGISIDLPGGFVYTQTHIDTLSIVSPNSSVLLIGSKYVKNYSI